MATQKNFFKISRQFGHAPSKRFASPTFGHQKFTHCLGWWCCQLSQRL